MFLNINLKTVIAFILSMIISLVSSIVIYRTIDANSPARLSYRIVLDAGHGGRDVK